MQRHSVYSNLEDVAVATIVTAGFLTARQPVVVHNAEALSPMHLNSSPHLPVGPAQYVDPRSLDHWVETTGSVKWQWIDPCGALS